MSNFEFVKLNQVCKKITDGSHYSPIGIDNGYPMLSVKDMLHNGFSYDDCKYVSEEDYNDLLKSDCVPKVNDVLIAKDGSYLKHVFVIKEEIKQGILSSIGILRPDLKKINPEYLKYYLHSNSVKETVAKKYVSGSALPRIILKNFGEIDIIYKPLIEQQKIAKILSDLDAKIEGNNRINSELEAMAKTLYDYWFVQFDFPDANGKPYKSTGGKMVWNQELKREIPEGWEVNNLEQFVELIAGNVSPKDINTNTLYIGLEHIPRRTIVLSEWETAAKINSNKCIFKKHDILFGKIRPYFHKVGIAFIDGITSTDTIVLRPRENSYQGFALQTVFTDDFVETATNSSTGSKMPRANWNILKNYKIATPSKEILNKYQLQFNNIIKKIELSVLENQELASLRDWLLPMLMNGQVSVGDVEEQLGMVAEGNAKYGKNIH
ncbi:restriction endonuclease subunit S [Flavobacterium frigidarium]|uniref:Restriction endonuclease subunit S n=1 Tax=Flavobacterium frigidarium TaxID=99286 RepID=A0ABV4KGJ0_9FLAO